MNKIEELDYLQLPSVRYDCKPKLPIFSGIYFVIDDSDALLYIGQALNIKTRWYYHHRRHEFKGRTDIRIAWLQVEKDDLRIVETILIDRCKPSLNMQRGSEQADVSILDFMRDNYSGLYKGI
jgi:excinuclease UvrABC nuclease subunit